MSPPPEVPTEEPSPTPETPDVAQEAPAQESSAADRSSDAPKTVLTTEEDPPPDMDAATLPPETTISPMSTEPEDAESTKEEDK